MLEGYTLNRPTGLACPECGGTLRVDRDGPMLRYVCHIGHALSGEAMIAAQADRVEHISTELLAALNEQQELLRQLMEAEEGDHERLRRLKNRATGKAEIVRDFLNRTLAGQ